MAQGRIPQEEFDRVTKSSKIILLSGVLFSGLIAIFIIFLLIQIPFLISLIFGISFLIVASFFASAGIKKFNGDFNEKVSIIISAKNEELVISKTIESLEKQEYENFEIIVVNDGSTDNTGEIIENMSKKYKNIKVLNVFGEDLPHGKAAAINRAFELVEGTVVLIIDADVILDKNYLKMVTKPFKNRQIDYVQSGIRTYSRGNFVSLLYDADYIMTNIFMAHFLKPRSFGRGILIRKDKLEKILPLKTSISEDRQMSIKLDTIDAHGIYKADTFCYEEAPQSLKSTWLQRKRWFLGDMIETLKASKMKFFLYTFLVFIFDLWIIAFVRFPFSFVGIMFLSVIIALMMIIVFNMKKFDVRNPFFVWIGALSSYFIDLLALNVGIFSAIFLVDKNVRWYKTPRRGQQNNT